MNRRGWLFAIAVVLLACSATGRVVLNGFVAWDDPRTITENPLLHPPTLQSLGELLKSSAEGLFIPLTRGAWWAIQSVTIHPWAFHLASLIAHCTASVLVFLILGRIVNNQLAACLGALVFAVHPLQVESVAWASGLKDVLAGVFALAAIHQHLSLSNSPRPKILAAVFFALAMLAKPSAASAILIAFIVDRLLLARTSRASMRSLLPWIVVALPLLIVARIVQKTQFVPHVDVMLRPLIAGDAFGFYLCKLIAPVHLAIDPGRSPTVVLASNWIWLRALWPIALLLALARLRDRTPFASLLILIAGLIWNLGLSPFQFQQHSTVADHYLYLAMLGPAICVAWIVARRPLANAVALLGVVVLAELSIRQTFVWRDSESLFRHAIDVNSRSVASRDDFGRLLGERNDLVGAGEQFRASIDIEPNNPDAWRNLALVEIKRDNIDTGLDLFEQSIRLNQARGIDVTNDSLMLQGMRARRRISQTRPSQ